MKRGLYLLAVLAASLVPGACGWGPQSLNEISGPQVTVVKLNRDTSFTFTEGPVFDFRGILYFTDGKTGNVFRMGKDLDFKTTITGAGRPDGMMVDHSGNLVVCDYDAKRLDLYTSEGRFLKTIAGSYHGHLLNGPNDVVIDRRGNIYFTDPFFQKPGAPQDAEGVYWVKPGGEFERICDHLSVPNGIILTPDEKTLLIVDSKEADIHAIDILPAGGVGNHRVWGKVTLPESSDGVSKPQSGSVGVAMDVHGDLYVATNLGIEVFNREGKSLGIIRSDKYKRPLNMTFDRSDPYKLIITAYESVYALKLNVKGISFPQLP